MLTQGRESVNAETLDFIAFVDDVDAVDAKFYITRFLKNKKYIDK
jgi:hypothetical protein